MTLPATIAPQHPGASPFDQIMEIDGDGAPVWRARNLMTLMGYPRWGDFQRVLVRATAAAQNTGMTVDEVFRRSPNNPSDLGGRPREDFKLTRDAAYLTALNGDPNKAEVAAAQLYFVEQTKKQEVAEIAPAIVERTPVAVDDLALMETMLHAIRADRQRLAAVEAVQAVQVAEQQEIRARMDGIEGRHDWFAALAYAKMNGVSTERGFLQRLGTAAGRITRRMGFEPAKAPHALYGFVNTYPLAALDGAVEALGGVA